MNVQRLPAAWEPQDAILLVWPQDQSEWGEFLADAIQLYEALVSVICDYADIVIAIPAADVASASARLAAMDIPLEYVYFHPVENLSSWVRDYAPITVQTEDSVKMLSFSLSKHASIATRFVQEMQAQEAFPAATMETVLLALSGGDLDTDGQGTLLLNSTMLSAPSTELVGDVTLLSQLKVLLGVAHIHTIALDVAENVGFSLDDVVRCCPNNTLVYMVCDDESDVYYAALKLIESALTQLKNAEGMPYRLMPLPWTGAIYNEKDERVLASYTGFVVVNEAVLVPIYDALSDEDALEIISKAFVGYEVFGIPSSTLLECGANLHRITLPLPEGVLQQRFLAS
jgi:agmatine deiminase